MDDISYDNLLEEYEKLVDATEYNSFRNTLHEAKGKVKHPFIMGSLDKMKYEEKDILKKYYDEHVNMLNISAKIDGISCRLHYEDGKLVSASTRGDGEFGESLTDKIQFVKNVPKQLAGGRFDVCNKSVDIRGELVILKDDFIEMAERFANPRNACAGIMGRKERDSNDVSKVSFIAYTILGDAFTKEEQFEMLEAWEGFNVAWHKSFSSHSYFKDNGLDLAEELFKYASQDFAYETDGLVLCGCDYRNEAKYRPDNCVAFKINQQTAQTTLVDVSFEGPSERGYVIPVAMLEPVQVGGSTISRATLNNLDFIASMGLKYGSKVELVRSGDVIPKILRVVSNDGKCKDIELPVECPSCGSALVRDGVNMRCMNKDCPAQALLKVTHFIKKLGVKSASEKTLKNFGITSFKKLVAFTPDKDYKSQMKLHLELCTKVFTRSKQDLLAAMPFNDLGEVLINKIVDFYGLSNIENGQYAGGLPDGIGETTLEKFKSAIQENLSFVQLFLNDSRWNPLESNEHKPGAAKEMKGSIVVTGSLKFGSRSKFLEFAAEHGYEAKAGVSKGLTYLINNDINSNSSKNKKAKALGIKIISEDEFMKLVSDSTVQSSILDI